MAAEPFIGKKRPCLSRIASAPGDFSVRDLQVRNKRDYLDWHERRLAGVLHWLESFAAVPLNKAFEKSQTASDAKDSSQSFDGTGASTTAKENPTESDEQTITDQQAHKALIIGGLPDVLVFPEGAIARRTLKHLSNFAAKQHCSVVAGTHAFQQNREAEEDYRNLRVSLQDIRYWVEKGEEGYESLFHSSRRDATDGIKEDDFLLITDPEIKAEFINRWKALKDSWDKYKISALAMSGKKESSLLFGSIQYRNQGTTPPATNAEEECAQLASDCALKFREWEYYKFCCMRLPTRSILTVIHPDGSVTFRLKVRLSPFEHTSSHATNDPLAEIEKPRLMTLKMPDRLLKFYPLVCSEALQGLHIPSKVELVAICSYQDKFVHFDHIIKHTAGNQVPVIYCNDGVTGGSQVATVFDERGENWWLDEPNFGKLPRGDAILIQDITVGGSATATGVFNPSRHEAFVAAAAIIPRSPKYAESRLAAMLERIEKTAFVGTRRAQNEHVTDYDQHHLVRHMKALRDRLRMTPIQRVKLDRLIQLVQNGQATRLRFWALGRDCLVEDHLRLRDVCGSDEPREGVSSTEKNSHWCSLGDLERQLAKRCQTFARHLLESTRSMAPEVAKMLMEVRDDCAHYCANKGSNASENANKRVAKFFQDKIAQSQEAARRNLRNLLGAVVERFQATSGSLFLHTETIADLSTGAHKPGIEPALHKGQLVMTTAYNVPSNYVENERKLDLSKLDNGNLGIVGRVALSGQGYLSNDVERDKNYNRQIGTTRSEMAVPVYYPSQNNELRLLGVLNLECNQRDAFLPVMLGELQAASAAFVPELILLSAFLDQSLPGSDFNRKSTRDNKENSHTLCCWHPSIHGWGKGHLLRDLCECITQIIDGSEDGTPFSCILWHIDTHKQVLYVRASCRYDYEYFGNYVLPHAYNDCKLPDNSFVRGKISFTGTVACHSDPTVIHRQVTDHVTPFRRREKASRMEVAQVIAGQIRLPEKSLTRQMRPREPENLAANSCEQNRSGPPEDSIGTISLYFFKHEEALSGLDVQQIFSDQVVLRLGEQVGELVDGSNALRLQAAVATLWARLFEGGVPFANATELVKNTLLEIFEADGCSLLLATNDGSEVELHSLATTGLRNTSEDGINVGGSNPHRSTKTPFNSFTLGSLAQKEPEVVSSTRQDTYPFKRYCGITRFLYDNPSTLVRKLDLLDPCEVVKPTSVNESEANYSRGAILVRPSRLCREITVAGRSEHRRFLGLSVSRTKEPGSETLGIVRLVRNPARSPFSVLDEIVLKSLASILRKLFLDADSLRRKFVDDVDANSPIVAPSDELLETKSRLKLLPVDGFWNRAFINGTLQDGLSVMREAALNSSDNNSHQDCVGEGFVLINLRVFHRDSQGRKKLDLYALHSELSNQPADEELLSTPRRRRESIGRTAIKLRSTIVFAKERVCPRTGKPVGNPLFLPIHSDSKLIQSGVCMPFAIAREDSFFIGVVSADTDQALDRWSGFIGNGAPYLVSKTGCVAISVLEDCATKLSVIGGGNCVPIETGGKNLVDCWVARVSKLKLPGNIGFTYSVAGEGLSCSGEHGRESKLSTWLMSIDSSGNENYDANEEASRTLLESSLYQLVTWGTQVFINDQREATLRLPLTRASTVIGCATIHLPSSCSDLWHQEGHDGQVSLDSSIVLLLCGCFYDWINHPDSRLSSPLVEMQYTATPYMSPPLTPDEEPFLWTIESSVASKNQATPQPGNV